MDTVCQMPETDNNLGFKNFTVLNHPIISHNLAIIRDKNSSCEAFRAALRKITYALVFEASRNIPMSEKTIETPIEKTKVDVFDSSAQLILAPILRAGLAFSEIASELLPFANVHHIGMYRDERTLEPIWYYDKKKKMIEDKSKAFVIILDPMLATGNSGVDAIQNFIKKGVHQEHITFMSLISAPEGVKNILNKFPDVKIVTAAYDRQLNSKGYIMPGLGDAGDRIFNTVE